MILHLYIARRFLKLFVQVFAGFFAFMVMIDLIDELRRFADPGLSLAEALQLSLMNVPATIYRILPLILILSAIALFLGLSRSSELVVVRSTGRSGLSFLLSPVILAFVIGTFAISISSTRWLWAWPCLSLMYSADSSGTLRPTEMSLVM